MVVANRFRVGFRFITKRESLGIIAPQVDVISAVIMRVPRDHETAIVFDTNRRGTVRTTRAISIGVGDENLGTLTVSRGVKPLGNNRVLRAAISHRPCGDELLPSIHCDGGSIVDFVDANELILLRQSLRVKASSTDTSIWFRFTDFCETGLR
jgi:hypothetical protein